MPQLGETVTEGTVAQWLKKPGDAIEKYEAFVEVSTDKVNAEVPSPVSGVLREIIAKEGETVATGAPIAIIDEVASAPAVPASTSHSSAGSASSTPVPSVATNGTHRNGATAASGNGNGNGSAAILRGVSPAVRRLAREHHIDVSTLRGTGHNGRITANDVLAAANEGPAASMAASIMTAPHVAAHVVPHVPSSAEPAPPTGKSTYANPIPGTIVPLSPARKLIAERMVEAVRTAPHAWTMVEVDVTNLWAWRNREKAAFERDNGMKLTLLPFFIRAVVESLASYPLMNATFTPEGIRVNADVNVAIAVALPDNLILPVIRNTDSLSIKGIAHAAHALIEKARTGKLSANELAAGTFTVNNTGANGSILSAPIIPVGQTGIVTMETVVKRAVVRDDDAIAVRSMMNVCLSLDHRVVDGSIANGFLADLKRRLEAMGPTGRL